MWFETAVGWRLMSESVLMQGVLRPDRGIFIVYVYLVKNKRANIFNPMSCVISSFSYPLLIIVSRTDS